MMMVTMTETKTEVQIETATITETMTVKEQLNATQPTVRVFGSPYELQAD